MENIPVGRITELKRDEIVDPIAVGKLFNDKNKPPRRKTRTVTFTIREEQDDAWRDFLQTFSGTIPQRGKGISSATVQLGMSIVMAIIADYKVDEVAEMLRSVIHPGAHPYTANALRRIAEHIHPTLPELIDNSDQEKSVP